MKTLPTPRADGTRARRRRAFIAAPLLGAIVFLASIVFVINLSKQESANTARVVSEAYHNRLTSLLEVYRSDVAALFRGSLSQVVEAFLSKQCWLNLFLISNNPTELDAGACDGDIKNCDLNKNGELDLKELRYYGCKRANKVIRESICPLPTSGSTCIKPDCYPSCATDLNCKKECEDYELCLAKNSYGLSKWMRYLLPTTRGTVVFEGIKYEIANSDQVDKTFINPENPDDFVKSCKALLQGSIFDCDAFSSGNMQCLDSGKVVEGCEEGTFFVKVSLTDQSVYPNLPRVEASDELGNTIRSGAIGEQEFFYLPITYPLFKYYDHAFNFYEDLEEKDSSVPSVPEGMCVQGTEKGTNGNCKNIPEYSDDSYTSVSGGADEAKKKIENDFFENKIKLACNKPDEPDEKRSLQLCTDANTCGSSELGAPAWTKNCNNADKNELKSGGNSLGAESKAALDQGGPAAFYAFVKLAARFKDESPVYQVDPTEPNRFCTYIAQAHVCKTGVDTNGFKTVGECKSSSSTT